MSKSPAKPKRKVPVATKTPPAAAAHKLTLPTAPVAPVKPHSAVHTGPRRSLGLVQHQSKRQQQRKSGKVQEQPAATVVISKQGKAAKRAKLKRSAPVDASATNTILDHPGDTSNAEPLIDAYQPKLFAMPVDPNAKGKTLESLANSRNQREDILRMFDGVLPTSIMEAKKFSNPDTDPVVGSYENTKGQMSTNKDGVGAKVSSFRSSGSGVAYGALSMFPRNICKAVLLLYSHPGDMVVDPFAGHNSRMETSVVNGRSYHGYDISHRFMEYNFKLADMLREDFPASTIELFEDDSRYMSSTPDGYGDFTVTSPPYWDIEDYGDESAQLGKLGGYKEFMQGLGAVCEQNFRALKPGAFAAWFINDFRRDGVFFDYHVHCLNALMAAGFVHHDTMIVNFGFPFRAVFAQQVIDGRILPKQHEYGLIMRKPL